MPVIVPGYNTENIVAVVTADESDINDAIATMATESWIVTSLTLSGTDVIILFTRTIPAS